MFWRATSIFLLLFAALYVMAVGLLSAFLIPSTVSHLSTCGSCGAGCAPYATIVCRVSAPVLAYWWLYLIPLLAITSVVATLALVRRPG